MKTLISCVCIVKCGSVLPQWSGGHSVNTLLTQQLMLTQSVLKHGVEIIKCLLHHKQLTVQNTEIFSKVCGF